MLKKNKQQKEERIAHLSVEIRNLKKTLHLKVQEHSYLSHPEVLNISRILDQKIVEYLKLVDHR